MQKSTEERIIIDRYLDDHLSGTELEGFMKRMEEEPGFRQAVSFQNLLIDGIRTSADHELEEKILLKIDYQKPKVPFGLKLIMTFMLVTGTGIVLWNYIGPGSTPGIKRYEPFGFFKNKKEVTKVAPKNNPRVKTNSGQSASKNSSDKIDSLASAALNSPGSSDENITTTATNIDSAGSQPVSESNDFIVKKDQLLMSMNIPIVEKDMKEGESTSKNPDHSTGGSLSQTTAEKLNPSAGLANDETHPVTSIETEFWVSPVNYQGYKFNGNKLIMYGIEEPDAIKLFHYQGNLFAKYGDVFYKIIPSEDYSSYIKIRESELPLNARQ